MDDEYYERPSRRLRWENVAAIILSGTGAALEQIADTFEGVASLLMQGGNYADSRDLFHQEAALELETLMEGEE